MSPTPTPPSSLRLPTAAAIGAAFWLAGGMGAISALAVPAVLLASPADVGGGSGSGSGVARQFGHMYAIGRVTQPPATLLTALLFAYVSRQHFLASGRDGAAAAAAAARAAAAVWKLYAAAGAAVGLTLPYTFALMEPTSRRLLALASPRADLLASVDGEQGAKALMRRWGVLNMARSVLPLAGGIIGIWTALAA